MSSEALKPCPFCGHVGLEFVEGSTFRWLAYSCAGCGTGNEVRFQTLSEKTYDVLMAEAMARAVVEWNRREPAAQAAEGGEALRAMARQVVEADDARALTQQHIDLLRAALKGDSQGGEKA